MLSLVGPNQRLFLRNETKSRSKPSIQHQNPCRLSNTIAFPFLPISRSNRITISCFPNASSKPLENLSFQTILPSFIFFAIVLSLRLLFSLFPPDFPQRWHRLLADAEEVEATASCFPCHLWQAIVACEDRRFFRHWGIDPIGISRAVVFFPDGGGGSTITQQLVKNVFLKHERKFSRKIIEMVLALMLERKLSKWKILCSYLSKIYWGHGMYGIESASKFYFGKHPSLLSIAESAMLAGIIPSPELRSPFREPSRGKTSQARALRKMVIAGFLDIDTAMLVLNQNLCLSVDERKHADGSSLSLLCKAEDVERSGKQIGKISATKKIWDWEKASAIWEVREYMEKWARKIQIRNVVFLPIENRNAVFLSNTKWEAPYPKQENMRRNGQE